MPNNQQPITNNSFAGAYAGKRVFLTGHTGFKGSWLAEWLLMLGAEVHGYALDPEPSAMLFDQLGLARRLESDTRADLADREVLTRRILEVRPHFVFHLAAQSLVRLSYEVPVETFATNVMGTIYLLDALRALQVAIPDHACAAVMVTTDKCYENREWLHAYREEDAMGGHDPYSASKGAAELVINAYRKSFFGSRTTNTQQPTTIHLASARAGNVIGGGDWAKDRIVPDCIRALRAGQSIAVRNKTATRPWQHVLEPLSGYLWLAARLAQEAGQVDGGLLSADGNVGAAPQTPNTQHPTTSLTSAFNFGPALASNRTVAELVQALLKHTGGEWTDASDPNALHEASKLNLATDKAFHLLGWQPAWNFETAVEKTANWYQGEADGEPVQVITRRQIVEYAFRAASRHLVWAL